MNLTTPASAEFSGKDNRMLTHLGLVLTLGAMQYERSSFPRAERYLQQQVGRTAATTQFGRSPPRERLLKLLAIVSPSFPDGILPHYIYLLVSFREIM